MNHEQKRIIIHRILHNDTHGADPHTTRRTSIFPTNNWLTIALLVPVVIVMTMVGFFFFAAFMALIAVAATVIGTRFWWLRRKYGQASRTANQTIYPDEDWNDATPTSHSKRSKTIEDAQIIEETKTDPSYRNNDR